MPKSDRLKVLLAAVNSGAYGTDATPTAADSIRAFDFTVSPQATRIDDTSTQAFLGAGDHFLVGKNVTASFKVRLCGAGTAGDAPPYGSLLRMCGLSETIEAGVSVTYDPISAGFEDGTLYFYRDRKRRKVVGARGTVSVVIERSSVPHLAFEMTGLYQSAADDTLPAIDWSGWQTALPAEPANVGAFSAFGQTPILQSLTLALGNSHPFISRVNQERVDINDRAATGEMVIEEPDTATFDPEALAIAHTRGLVTFQHGTTAGNMVTVNAPAAQLGMPSEGESDGTAMLTLDLSLKPSAGNDEWQLVVA
ncbi:hypothetical protein [Roseospirillum parvum]|uniref:Uncharacterized protein n=1 Tax=Roseospirillum parvum TaxID=83401 RepID=A0A1G8EWY1_9PROT|nr:hypothetical protein [Roseospirillum parvum]SDH74365.1 hypothetical protein SAMN05421742_11167 [Roseospirillum parvum]